MPSGLTPKQRIALKKEEERRRRQLELQVSEVYTVCLYRICQALGCCSIGYMQVLLPAVYERLVQMLTEDSCRWHIDMHGSCLRVSTAAAVSIGRSPA